MLHGLCYIAYVGVFYACNPSNKFSMDQKISTGQTIYASTLGPMMQVYIQDMLYKISGWEKATKKPSKFCMVKILSQKLIWEKRKDQFLKILIFVEIHGMQFYFAGEFVFIQVEQCSISVYRFRVWDC